MKKFVIVALGSLLFSLSAAAEMVATEMLVTMTAPLSSADTPQLYSVALTKLALEKTRAQYGGYRIQTIPATTRPRSLANLANNVFPNALIETGYDEKLTESGKLTFIKFSLDGGIAGYRVCFVNPAIKPALKQNISLAQLRTYSFGQGANWSDTIILRHNGFQVSEFSSYDGLFKMVAVGRIDFFCRGANEVVSEQKIFRDVKNLTVDESFVLVYPLPRFFYVNSSNTLLNERMSAGLKIAYEDGSFTQLWREYYKADVESLKLHQRTIFRLENPLLKNISADYQRYAIDPLDKSK
jgi:hypothetical protein